MFEIQFMQLAGLVGAVSSRRMMSSGCAPVNTLDSG